MEQISNRIKFWTVQKKSVMDEVEEKGIFYPDFSKSTFVSENKGLADLYQFLLTNYNRVNACDYNGLIFSFMRMHGDEVTFFNNYDSFKAGIIENREKIESMWKKFIEMDAVVVEIEMETHFNPFLIDINNWQFLMPPVIALPPYQSGDFNTIVDWLRNGTFGRGYYDPTLMQAHIPYIKKDDVVAVYPMFSLD